MYEDIMTCNVCPCRIGFRGALNVHVQDGMVSCHMSRHPVQYPMVLDVDGNRWVCSTDLPDCPAKKNIPSFPKKPDQSITEFVRNGRTPHQEAAYWGKWSKWS